MNEFFEWRMERGMWGLLFAVFLLSSVAVLDRASASEERNPDSMAFPHQANTSDVGDILESYPAYLRYVLDIGREVDHGTAQRLDQAYAQLRAKDPTSAARFLKGLRFEMVQKLEMIGLSEEAATTRNATMRRWVARYLPAWYRECDEYLFRSRVAAVTKR